jgi:hypothetical protein
MHTEVLNFMDRARTYRPDLFAERRVVEFGSYFINGSVRGLFDDCDYTGVDWRPGPGVDVVSLAHQYAPVEGSPPIDLCISTEMLEHDPHWRESVANMVRLLDTGGSVILTCAAPGRPVHETDCAPAPDYYRPVGVIELVQHLRELAQWDLIWAEQPTHPADSYVAALGKQADPVRPMTSVVMGMVNNVHMTGRAILSLWRNQAKSTEYIVVDNGSSPEQSDYLLRNCWELLGVYLRYDQPLGYPAANNRGIQVAAGQCVALCNNDTEMLTARWDETLHDALPNRADMVSPVFDYVGNAGQLYQEGAEGVREARVLFFVMVYCYRSLFAKIGLLDERFGLGNSEDTDFSARVVQAGGRLWVQPAVQVHHAGHATFGMLMSRDDFQSLIASNREKLVAKWQ